jgi:hypothetical protein
LPIELLLSPKSPSKYGFHELFLLFKDEIRKKRKPEKKRGKRGPLILSLSSKMRATPTSLLLIKRSGTPPSLSI